MYRLLPLLILILIVCQSLAAQSFGFQYIGSEAGRPFSEVTALMIDHRDFLWVGGADGSVCRFDGLVYTCWGEADGLPGGRINDLSAEFHGPIWAATDNGLAVIDGNQWITPIADKRTVNHISILPEGLKSTVFAAKDLGLFTDYEGQLRALHPELIEQRFTAMLTDDNETFIASSKGIYRIGLDLRAYPLDELPKSEVRSMVRFDDNHLLLAMERVGLVSLNKQTGRLHILNADPLLHRPVTLIADSVRSGFWLSTAGNGLIRLDKSAEIVERFRPPGRIMDAGGPVVLDRWGQLWLGGDDEVVIARPSQLNTLELNQKEITTRSRKQNSQFWQSDGAGRISILSGDTLARAIELSKDDKPFQIKHIVSVTDSTAWVGGVEGLAHLEPDTAGYFKYKFREDLPEKRITSLLLAPDSSLWVGQPNSNLVRIDTNGRATYFDRLDGLPSGTISNLAIDRFNRLWAMSTAGPYWTNLANDTLRWRPIPREFFDPGIAYHQLLPTEEGLWLTTDRSLQLLRWQTDSSWAEREVFGPERGWSATPTRIPAWMGEDGRRYFPTRNGLVEYRPDFNRYEPSPPHVFIRDVSLFYESVDRNTLISMLPHLHAAPRFEPDENHFSFQFRAVDLQSPGNIFYRYRLRGNSDDWSPPTQSTSVSYAGLSPGFYQFDVNAKTKSGRWGSDVGIEFYILPPWWQRGIMPYLLGLLICTSAGSLLYAYIARLRKREKARRSALELQNKLLSLEQQALQLQMNPHFIFNALGGIQSLIGTGQDLAKARRELQEFATLMRGILHNSRQQKISLTEEVKVLEGYLKTASNLQSIPFDYEVQVDPTIDLEEVELPPMLIQPFVENAIIHGVSPLQTKGHIKVEFTRYGDLLQCRIIDNGIGRESAARLRQAKQPGHRSVATEVNRQRLELMRGEEKYSALIIKDGKAETGQPKGTEVILNIKDAFSW
ncbi:MAG: histidine kinase [Bacteroidota bacterium]